MLSERRHRLFTYASWIEMLELWDRARIPEYRLPQSIIHERVLGYFAFKLREAWTHDNSAALGDVLIELYLVATGQELVEGWDPPALCCGAELRAPL